MKTPKKKILILNTTHAFGDLVLPTIKLLKNNFDITLVLIDYFTPKYLKSKLLELKNKNEIENCYLLTNADNYKNFLKNIYQLKSTKKKLLGKKFNFFFSANFTILEFKYINDLINSDCKKVLLQTQYLDFISKYFRKNKVIISNIEKTKNFLRYIFFLAKKILIEINNLLRNIVFFLFTGKFFYFKDYIEKSTNILSLKTNTVFTDDRIEKKIIEKYIKKKLVKLISIPTNNCRCKKSIKKFSNCLLLTESGFFEKNSLRKSLFENYINDVIFLCKKFKLNCVHYKLHPRSRGKWHIKFIDQLRKNNLKIELLDQKNFINKIACDYPVIASALSGSLKIARRSCNKIKVVGLINQSIPAHGNLNYRQLLDNNGIEWLEDPKKFNTSNTKKTFYKNKKRKILTDYIK